MKKYLSLLLLLTCSSINSTVLAYAFPGWEKSIDKKGAIVYKPESGSGELVKIYPPVLLENEGAEIWLSNKLSNSKAPKGNWADNKIVIVRQTANLATGHRQFTQPDGTPGVLSAFAYTADRQYVRLGVYIGSWKAKSRPTFKEGMKILGTLPEIEQKTALTEQRGIDKEKSPPKVDGMTTGGIKVKPGRYVGTRTRGTKVIRRYEIMLYASGEYEFLGTDDHGEYSFSALTGRLNMEGDFSNGTYDYLEDFCVYGIDDRSEKHMIYARDGSYTYRLAWANEPDRPSPREREQLEKLAKEEADRYKHVTSPGDGLQIEDIEAVIYTSELEVGMSTSVKADAYVLMKDGRVMDSMPVAPNMLDVAKSRSRDPDSWGYWKAEKQSFVFSWSVDQKKFVAPSGTQHLAQAIPRGTQLDGTWEMTKSSASLDYSSVSTWGVKLASNGRFAKYHNNSSLSGGGSTGMGVGPMVGVFSDEEGSQSVISGANIGGGTKTVKNNSKNNNQGWYEFDGYNLTLKYDNGKVDRLLTFSAGDNFDTLWFENGSLARKTE